MNQSRQIDRTNKPLLIIIGPSGTGKSTVIQLLLENDRLELIPSWTTRPPRDLEESRQGEHVFVSEADFAAKKASHYFLETVTLFGLPYEYGLPPINFKPGKLTILMLRAPLISILEGHYPIHIIYQIEAAKELVQSRLRERAKEGHELGERLLQYEAELTLGRKLADRTFVNNSAASLVKEIRATIHKDFQI